MDDKLESKKDSRTGLSLASISFYQSFPKHCMHVELCNKVLLPL